MLSMRRPVAVVSSLVFVACSLLSLALAPHAAAQQKYRLTESAAKGDVSENSGTFSMKMKMTVTVAGVAQDTDARMTQQEKYREEVLAVDAKGIPTAVRRPD